MPGTPSAALVCRYTNAVSPDGVGTLYASKALTRSQTDQLAAAARAIVPLVGQTESCGAHFGDNRYTVLAFAVPGRSDVDIWFQSDLDCTGLTNGLFTVAIGTRESGEFHTLLDSMAPPPPYSG